MSLFNRRRPAGAAPAKGIAARRPHPGLLRRERRELLHARDARLRDLGGLVVEMYRRGAHRDDLMHERCAEVVGIDARLAEIDELLHGSDGTERCASCGAAVLRGSHFCPNCGRLLDGNAGSRLEDTVIAPAPVEDD
jgi:zinc-ribbon domain